MSNVQQETAVAVRMQDLSPEYAEIMVLGKVLQMSGYFRDVQDQAQAVTKILFGRELGFSPIVSMGGIYIIEGKPALSSNLLAATIKRSGKYDYRIKTWDNTQCVLLFKEKRDGQWDDLGESSFNLEDAKRAGVAGKGNWNKYPKAMLFARALSQGERAYCPDVSACPLYVPEELGATVNENGEVLSTQDLPKSARPVAVTTEDIPLGAPTMGVGAGAPTSAPAQAPELHLPGIVTTGESSFPIEKPFYNKLQDDVKAKSEKKPVDPNFVEFEGCVSVKQKKAFARAFEDACDPKITAAEKRRLRADWLILNGFVKDGAATSALIPAAIFEDMKRIGCQAAAKYKPNAHGIVVSERKQ